MHGRAAWDRLAEVWGLGKRSEVAIHHEHLLTTEEAQADAARHATDAGAMEAADLAASVACRAARVAAVALTALRDGDLSICGGGLVAASGAQWLVALRAEAQAHLETAGLAAAQNIARPVGVFAASLAPL